jgi:sporulation protein YlmC with PRC-barrel domain
MAKSTADVLSTACAMARMRVETADGRRLGHVFDLRCRPADDGSATLVIDEIIYGEQGLLERLSLRRTTPRSVHWYLVEAIRGDVIVVAASKR